MKTHTARWCTYLVASAFLFGPAVAMAALPDQFPADTMLYLAWPGSEQIKQKFQGTALADIMSEPQMQQIRVKLLPAIDALIKKRAGEQIDAENYAKGKDLLAAIYKYPTAVALVSVDANAMVPLVHAGIVVEAGSESEAMAKSLDTILAQADPSAKKIKQVKIGRWKMKEMALMGPAMALRWGVIDGRLVVAWGNKLLKHLVPEHYVQASEPEDEGTESTTPAQKTAAAVPASKSLAQNPSFIKAMQVTGGSAETPVVFLNVKAAIRTLETFQPMLGAFKLPILGEEGGVRKLLGDLGVAKAESFTMAWAPQAGGLKSTSFFHCPGMPRIGKPLTEADLALIPQDASWATVANLNLARIYERIIQIVGAISPEAHKEMTKAIGEIEEKIGMSLGKDLLGSFGDTWVIYDQPANGGLLITGMTIIVSTQPGRNIDEVIRKLVELIPKDRSMKVTLRDEQYRGHKIGYMNFSGIPIPVAPAWAEHDGRMLIGLFPQMVRMAIDRSMDKGKSILENEGFRRGWKQMPAEAQSMNYINADRGVQGLYSIALPVVQALVAMGQKEGLDLDIALLPSMQVISKHLFDNVAAGATTPDGLVQVEYGAVPPILPAMGQNTGATPLLVSILLPSLARARELARRSTSLANLGSIARASLTYAEAHRGKLPPDLETLTQGGRSAYLKTKQLISPGDPKPGKEASYIYLGKGMTNTMDPGLILAYERPEFHEGEGTNAAFLDGHAKWLSQSDFEEQLEKTKQALKALDEKGSGEKNELGEEKKAESRRPQKSEEEEEEARPTARGAQASEGIRAEVE